MKIIVGFDNGETILIENSCDVNRLAQLMAYSTKKDTKLIVINDAIINLDKLTYIKEYKENSRPSFIIKEDEGNEDE